MDEAKKQVLKRVSCQLLNGVDHQPLPGVRVRSWIDDAVSESVTTRLGEFDFDVREKKHANIPKPVSLRFELVAPDGSRIELVEAPERLSQPPLELHARVEPLAIDGIDWFAVRRLLSEVVPTTLGALAQELVSPSTFDLTRVPLEDRHRHLRALERSVLDPRGELAAHLGHEALAVSVLRDRAVSERIKVALADARLAAQDRAKLDAAFDRAAATAQRAPLFSMQALLRDIPAVSAAFAPQTMQDGYRIAGITAEELDEIRSNRERITAFLDGDDTAARGLRASPQKLAALRSVLRQMGGDSDLRRSRALNERWADTVEKLGIRDQLANLMPAESCTSPRLLLQSVARTTPKARPERPSELKAVTLAARFASLGVKPESAVAISKAGVKSMRALASRGVGEVAAILGGNGALAEATRIQTRSRQALALTRARLVEVGLGASQATGRIALYQNPDVSGASGIVPLIQANTPANTCEPCENCLSALSPGAYLVDLLDFMSDSFGWTLTQIENRFLQPFGQWPLDCDAVEEKDLQIAFANEVLASFIRGRRNLAWRVLGAAEIDALYDEFAALNAADVFPSTLLDAYEAYRTELRAAPAAITQALGDAAQRQAIAQALWLDEADLPTLVLAANAIHRSTIQQIYDLLFKSHRNRIAALLEENLRAETYAAARERLVGALDPTDPNHAQLLQQAEAAAANEATAAVNATRAALQVQAEEEARAYCDSVRHGLNKTLLTQCRANLIYIALQAVQANPIAGRTLSDARRLGDYLCVDLGTGDCLETTRVAFAIESLQTFVQSYLLGHEPSQAAAFDARRWRWERSFGLWAAAQAVFLYPENFLSPQFRMRRTEAFDRMMDTFDTAAPSRTAARNALRQYSEEVRDFAGTSAFRAVQVGDKLYLLCIGALSRYLYISSIDSVGAWSGWRRIEELRGEVRPGYVPLPDIQDVVVLGGRIFVLYREVTTFKAFALVFEPEGVLRATVEIAPGNVRLVRATAIETPARQEVLFFVQQFVPPNTTGYVVLDVYRLGIGQQAAVAAEKKIYLPQRSELSAMAAHVSGNSSTQLFNPHVLFTCLLYGDANQTARLVTYVVPSGLVPPNPEDPGDVIVSSFPSIDIPLQANVNVGGLSVLSLGPREFGGAGINKVVITFYRQFATPDWRMYLIDFPTRAIEKSMVSSANASAIPADVPATWFTCAGLFGGDIYGVFGSWLCRLPGPAQDWASAASWRLVGQILLGGEQSGRPLRVDLDELADVASLTQFRALQTEHWDSLRGGGYARRYLEELFLHAPLWLAARLNEESRFDAARELLEVVFRPFGSGLPSPFVYEGILREQALTSPHFDYRSTIEYLQNPFDPHAIAGIRPLTYARYAVQSYADNLIDWADAEFTRDTPESVASARELYESAGDILDLSSVPQDLCGSGYGTLLLEVLKALPSTTVSVWRPLLQAIWAELKRLDDEQIVQDVLRTIRKILRKNRPEPQKRAALSELLQKLRALQGPNRRTIRERTDTKDAAGRDDELENWGMGYLDVLDEYNELEADFGTVQVPAQYFDYGFCIPRNPAYEGLRFRIESNLEKIRTCRNIAGIRRSLESYAVVQDPTALIQQAQAGGGDIEDFIPAEPPPMFRYSYLWERARQATTTAQHIESYLLTSLEKLDAARYSLFQAKNDLKLAGENVAVHALRVREAGLGVTQATLQRDRAHFSVEHFQELLDDGLNGFEDAALLLLRIASFVPSSVSVSFGASPSVSVGVSPSGILQNEATIQNTRASYERRAEEWRYQRALAGWDERIGQAQIDVAGAQLDISNRELQVASITAEQAGQTVEFLSEQFTSAELYRWMVKELRKLYRRQLSLAVGLGRSAQQALAFELQEPLNFVGIQYWETKREGLLGSEQLNLDLERLDQHRIARAERRRELTKTLSLAMRMPSEFQQLRSTGLLTFAMPMSWFDRDFPGHYMRLIKSVEFSVIALTPALDGIHANVSHHGLSRVMVGPPFAAPTILQRPPETVSLSSPRSDSGLFQLRLEDPMLLPFEGSGVDTTWTLELAKGANSFNFETLVDVLMTIRYTAKDDFGYRQRIVADLETQFTALASFAARQSFADAWFHLHNPIFRQNPADYGFGAGQVRPPYAFRIQINRHYFPANEQDITLRRVILVSAQEAPGRIPVRVEFLPDGAAAPLVSGNQEIVDGSLNLGLFFGRSPFGTWTVWLRNNADPAAYPEFFAGSTVMFGQRRLDLAGLRELILVVDYSAHVRYPRA